MYEIKHHWLYFSTPVFILYIIDLFGSGLERSHSILFYLVLHKSVRISIKRLKNIHQTAYSLIRETINHNVTIEVH